MPTKDQIKNKNQYKHQKRHFMIFLRSLLVYLSVIVVLSLFFMIDELKFGLFFLVYGTLSDILILGSPFLFFGIRMIRILKDDYHAENVEVVSYDFSTSEKIYLTLQTGSGELKDAVIFKDVFDSDVSLKTGSVIEAYIGKENVLL